MLTCLLHIYTCQDGDGFHCGVRPRVGGNISGGLMIISCRTSALVTSCGGKPMSTSCSKIVAFLDEC